VLIVAVVLLPFITWGLALAGGWNAAALSFLLTTWPIIIGADSSHAPQLAAREDQTEGSARVLLAGASVASLLGAGYALPVTPTRPTAAPVAAGAVRGGRCNQVRAAARAGRAA
jgi:hypothetical protein